MLNPSLISLLTLATLAAAPAPVLADTVIAPGVKTDELAALDGTVVWISGESPNLTLMRRSPDGVIAPVKAAPTGAYASMDLGRSSAGRLVLTYQRCGRASTACRHYSDDLAGHHVAFKRLAPKGCKEGRPARWGSRTAYELTCSGRGSRRSGLFVRTGGGAPTRLSLPKGVSRNNPYDVDLRGARVSARASINAPSGGDEQDVLFSQTVNARSLRSLDVITSEGLSTSVVERPQLGAGGALWTLVKTEFDADPPKATLERLSADGCPSEETLPASPVGDDFGADKMAVDGDTIYLYVPGTGIVSHEFAPDVPCSSDR